jgi:2-polyprenyl-3-methyl-5-hydroxy-6-metoxy-1,4-benzoquinol methylase
MPEFDKINKNYLKELVEFLYSIRWMFVALNTQYIKEKIIINNNEFIATLNNLDLNNFPELELPDHNFPECLQKFIEQVNKFKITFDTIATENWIPTPMKRMSVKKQYEIENVSKVIQSICKDEVNQLVDFGSGVGNLCHYLCEKFGFKVLGVEGCSDRVEKANERQQKYYPNSVGRVKHAEHYISEDSENFILKHFDDNDDDPSSLAILGLHGCGDLTVVI